ncbi:MAG: reverse transcriptase domain-containing protein [Oscillospiraceae bacterium]|nr:reverse transcriptase domain-containing protein [Oscillospiraceae bacterium]
MTSQNPDIVIKYIKTKNKIRKIYTYSSDDCELRKYHQKIYKFLEQRFVPSIFTKGYVKGRSIYQNAKSHMYNDYFIKLDIKDFFPHICHKQLIDKMYYEMNILEKDQISKLECINIIEKCSISNRGIPLGFITSPILSNIYLKEFDNIFYGKLKALELNNLVYTRYADDLTLSFKYNKANKCIFLEDQIINIANELLKRYGLFLNKNKTHSYNLNISNHVRITGINISILENGKRKLTVGRSEKNFLYWQAINCIRDKDKDKIKLVKGLQSYILSVEKIGSEDCYSKNMKDKVKSFGYNTLKELIDNL